MKVSLKCNNKWLDFIPKAIKFLKLLKEKNDIVSFQVRKDLII